MNTVAEVLMWGRRVGAVSWNEARRSIAFSYDPEFVATGLQVAPIMMPLGGEVFSFGRRGVDPDGFRGLPGMLADSLPDKFGNAIIEEWQRTIGRSDPLNPVEKLCYVGVRGMGALEYKPALKGGVVDTSEVLHMATLAELSSLALRDASAFRARIADDKQGLHELLKVGTSAGGARAKAIVAYNPATKEFRSGKVDGLKGFQHYLVKFDELADFGSSTVSLARVEYAYYRMAQDCGVNMTECYLHDEGEKAHFITKRFDRTEGGEKLHMQTLAALRHYDFEQPNLYSYGNIFSTIRGMGLPYADKEQLFRRMVFNVVARNQDDHVKNFSFLMNKRGEWSLSPAYDVTYAYNPYSNWTAEHQCAINGKRTGITQDDLLAVGRLEEILKPERVVEQVWDTVSQWKKYAELANLSKEATTAIGGVLLPMQGKAQVNTTLNVKKNYVPVAKVKVDTVKEAKNFKSQEKPTA
jgi:serine/threonine-protein kinase HipA